MAAKRKRAPDDTRSRLLARILRAEFPKQADEFMLPLLEQARLTKGFTQPPSWSNGEFKLFVLLAIQVRELRRQCDEFRRERAELLDELADLRHPFSPLRLLAMLKLDPVEEAELNRQAAEEERRMTATRERKKQEQEEAQLRDLEGRNSKPWTRRDEPVHRPSPCLWHQPMTQEDYRRATGLSRPTIRSALRAIGAHPQAKRPKANVAHKFAAETNFGFFCDWLTRRERNHKKRSIHFAKNLLFCSYEAPDQLPLFIQKTKPVWQAVGRTRQQRKEFIAYLKQLESILFRKPSPVPPSAGADLYAEAVSGVGNHATASR